MTPAACRSTRAIRLTFNGCRTTGRCRRGTPCTATRSTRCTSTAASAAAASPRSCPSTQRARGVRGPETAPRTSRNGVVFKVRLDRPTGSSKAPFPRLRIAAGDPYRRLRSRLACGATAVVGQRVLRRARLQEASCPSHRRWIRPLRAVCQSQSPEVTHDAGRRIGAATFPPTHRGPRKSSPTCAAARRVSTAPAPAH